MEKLLEKLERDPGAHKGENGYVGVLAGSRDYTGAPALVGQAALRTGCDLARILTSRSSREVTASFSEDLIVRGYQSDYFDGQEMDAARELAEWADAVAVGPGLGDPDGEAVREFLSGSEVPAVVDADAVEPALEAGMKNAVFTPHSGEAEVIADRFGSVEEFVDEKRVVAVVKGSTDVVYTPEKTYRNETGTPAMTVGGTGDVLTGIIASLLSQGLEPRDAARLGAWINGRAGEKAEESYGNGLLATDLLEEIPRVMEEDGGLRGLLP